MKYTIKEYKVEYIEYGEREEIDLNIKDGFIVKHALGYSRKGDQECDYSAFGLIINLTSKTHCLDFCICAYIDFENEPLSLQNEDELSIELLKDLYPKAIKLVNRISCLYGIPDYNLSIPDFRKLWKKLVLFKNTNQYS
ncbi:hypothetical protein [Mycoplasma sp. P36-A1]|uniref:hypothetical protein n=1 Tax=Mycoplasma sp. P36-A1 TaxID=3252900 RepID=UPI003C2B0A57